MRAVHDSECLPWSSVRPPEVPEVVENSRSAGSHFGVLPRVPVAVVQRSCGKKILPRFNNALTCAEKWWYFAGEPQCKLVVRDAFCTVLSTRFNTCFKNCDKVMDSKPPSWMLSRLVSIKRGFFLPALGSLARSGPVERRVSQSLTQNGES